MCWELCDGNCHWCDITWMWGDYCSGCKNKIAEKEKRNKTNLESTLKKYDSLLKTDYPSYDLRSSSFTSYNTTPIGSRLRNNSSWNSSL